MGLRTFAAILGIWAVVSTALWVNSGLQVAAFQQATGVAAAGEITDTSGIDVAIAGDITDTAGVDISSILADGQKLDTEEEAAEFLQFWTQDDYPTRVQCGDEYYLIMPVSPMPEEIREIIRQIENGEPVPLTPITPPAEDGGP